MEVGLQAIRALQFVLQDPPSRALIQTVGESSIVLRFYAWVDQRPTDFLKARSLAIQATKHAVEEAGYELPEPIYRIRFDDRGKSTKDVIGEPDKTDRPTKAPAPAVGNATPDRTIENLVSKERSGDAESDLLDAQRPVE